MKWYGQSSNHTNWHQIDKNNESTLSELKSSYQKLHNHWIMVSTRKDALIKGTLHHPCGDITKPNPCWFKEVHCTTHGSFPHCLHFSSRDRKALRRCRIKGNHLSWKGDAESDKATKLNELIHDLDILLEWRFMKWTLTTWNLQTISIYLRKAGICSKIA